MMPIPFGTRQLEAKANNRAAVLDVDQRRDRNKTVTGTTLDEPSLSYRPTEVAYPAVLVAQGTDLPYLCCPGHVVSWNCGAG